MQGPPRLRMIISILHGQGEWLHLVARGIALGSASRLPQAGRRDAPMGHWRGRLRLRQRVVAVRPLYPFWPLGPPAPHTHGSPPQLWNPS